MKLTESLELLADPTAPITPYTAFKRMPIVDSEGYVLIPRRDDIDLDDMVACPFSGSPSRIEATQDGAYRMMESEMVQARKHFGEALQIIGGIRNWTKRVATDLDDNRLALFTLQLSSALPYWEVLSPRTETRNGEVDPAVLLVGKAAIGMHQVLGDYLDDHSDAAVKEIRSQKLAEYAEENRLLLGGTKRVCAASPKMIQRTFEVALHGINGSEEAFRYTSDQMLDLAKLSGIHGVFSLAMAELRDADAEALRQMSEEYNAEFSLEQVREFMASLDPLREEMLIKFVGANIVLARALSSFIDRPVPDFFKLDKEIRDDAVLNSDFLARTIVDIYRVGVKE